MKTIKIPKKIKKDFQKEYKKIQDERKRGIKRPNRYWMSDYIPENPRDYGITSHTDLITNYNPHDIQIDCHFDVEFSVNRIDVRLKKK